MLGWDFISFIILLVTIDVTFTYANISLYRKYHPADKNWATMERNPIANYIIRHAGLGAGMLILWIFASALISFLLFISNAGTYEFMFVFGMYSTVIYIHLLMLLAIYRQKGKMRRKF